MRICSSRVVILPVLLSRGYRSVAVADDAKSSTIDESGMSFAPKTLDHFDPKRWDDVNERPRRHPNRRRRTAHPPTTASACRSPPPSARTPAATSTRCSTPASTSATPSTSSSKRTTVTSTTSPSRRLQPPDPLAQGGAGELAATASISNRRRALGASGQVPPRALELLQLLVRNEEVPRRQVLGQLPPKPTAVPTDRWICVEIMLKCNSAPDKSDGEQAMWIDGKEVGGWQLPAAHRSPQAQGRRRLGSYDYITEPGAEAEQREGPPRWQAEHHRRRRGRVAVVHRAEGEPTPRTVVDRTADDTLTTRETARLVSHSSLHARCCWLRLMLLTPLAIAGIVYAI